MTRFDLQSVKKEQLPEIAELNRRLEAHRGEVVLHDVDCGRICQFWFAPMFAAELEQWWQSQETFEDNPDGVKHEVYRVFGETPPSHNKHVIPGTGLNAECEEAVLLWMEMERSREHYRCVLCCDNDSYLMRPDGIRIYHRGRTQRE